MVLSTYIVKEQRRTGRRYQEDLTGTRLTVDTMYQQAHNPLCLFSSMVLMYMSFYFNSSTELVLVRLTLNDVFDTGLLLASVKFEAFRVVADMHTIL